VVGSFRPTACNVLCIDLCIGMTVDVDQQYPALSLFASLVQSFMPKQIR